MDAAYRSLGRAGEVEWTPDGVEVEAPPARLVVRFLASDVVRVDMSPTPETPAPLPFALAGSGWESPRITREERGGTLRLASDALEVEIALDPVRIAFRDGQGRLLDRDDPRDGMGWRHGSVHSFREARPGDRAYGFGEKTGPLDKHGREMTMWTTDVLPHLPTTDPLYQAIPFYLIWNDGRVHGLFFENSHRSRFDMDREGAGRYHVWFEGGRLVYYLFAGPTFPQVLERYTRLTGRMPLPPRWSLGFQQSRWGYVPQERVEALARTFRERRIPCDVIYLDIDYMDGYRVFTWDPKRFADPSGLCRGLKEQGFRVVTIVDPGVKVDPSYPVFREGLEAGSYVEDSTGRPYTGRVWPGEVYFPDFLQERVRRWWGEWHRALLDAGVAGIWNDMNEPANFRVHDEDRTLPEGALHRTDEGEVHPHREVHNLYALLMGQATAEALRRLRPQERPFLLTRSGFAGIQRYAAVWTGDNSSWWEHLAMAIPMLLNLGLSGVAFVGTDVGGFRDDAEPELYARWVQMGAFTPFFRAHTAHDTRDQEPWSFGARVEAIARSAIELRYRILPYLYTLFWEAHQTGAPVMRPLVYHFPGDPVAARIQDAFLLGPDLLVAPVLQPQARERMVYLPEGEWVDFWTGEVSRGPAHRVVEAPLERIPLFVRAGAVLPLGPVTQHTGEDGWQELTLRLHPGEAPVEWRGVLYEDDGATPAYEQGVSSRRAMNLTAGPRHLVLVLDAPEGSYAPARQEVGVEVPFLPGPPQQVLLDGHVRAEGTGYTYEAGRGLALRMPQAGAHRLEVAW